MAEREGWSVAIRRADGSEFLAHPALGMLPPVWPLSQRKYAVAHKRDLIGHGFRARVVRVRFSDPEIVEASHG